MQGWKNKEHSLLSHFLHSRDGIKLGFLLKIPKNKILSVESQATQAQLW